MRFLVLFSTQVYRKFEPYHANHHKNKFATAERSDPSCAMYHFDLKEIVLLIA